MQRRSILSSNFETDLALDNVTMVSMSVSDTESDTPFSASLSGTGAGSLKLVYTNANSSSRQLTTTRVTIRMTTKNLITIIDDRVIGA